MDTYLICIMLLLIMIMATLRLISIIVPKYQINKIFYCDWNNKICMRVPFRNTKKWKANSYNDNIKEMLKGWDKLPVNTTFRCTTHSVFKRHIERQEKMGKLKILKCKQCILHTNLTVLEKSLGKKSDFSGKVTKYKIKFRT